MRRRRSTFWWVFDISSCSTTAVLLQHGDLKVHVIAARDLPDTDNTFFNISRGDWTDPFVTVFLDQVRLCVSKPTTIWPVKRRLNFWRRPGSRTASIQYGTKFSQFPSATRPPPSGSRWWQGRTLDPGPASRVYVAAFLASRNIWHLNI